MFHCHVKHINWKYYVLMLYFSQGKKKQEGLNMNTPWHVHSYPNNPLILPVNALVMYIFYYPQNIMGDSTLFPCLYHNNRYNMVLSNIITYCTEFLDSYGKV